MILGVHSKDLARSIRISLVILRKESSVKVLESSRQGATCWVKLLSTMNHWQLQINPTLALTKMMGLKWRSANVLFESYVWTSSGVIKTVKSSLLFRVEQYILKPISSFTKNFYHSRNCYLLHRNLFLKPYLLWISYFNSHIAKWIWKA